MRATSTSLAPVPRSRQFALRLINQRPNERGWREIYLVWAGRVAASSARPGRNRPPSAAAKRHRRCPSGPPSRRRSARLRIMSNGASNGHCALAVARLVVRRRRMPRPSTPMVIDVGPPVELVAMEGGAARRDQPLRAPLRADGMVVGLGVERRIDEVRLRPDLLHDVDLAVVGPFLEVLAKHPDRRPGAAGARQLRPDFVEAVGPGRRFETILAEV